MTRRLSDIVCNQQPLTMSPETSVQAACVAMRERRVGSVLVTDAQGKLLGVFTGRDAVYRVLARGRSAAKTRLADVMTADPVTMPPTLTAIDALRLMWDGGFRHVPLIDNGRLVGIVSRGDFTGCENERLEEERALWEHMR